MTITLDPQLEAALIEQARRQGVSPESLALAAIRARILVPGPADDFGDEWVRRLRRVATECGVALSDDAVSSEGIYE